MGCRSDYMRANVKEKQTKNAATLYVYLASRLGEEVPEYVTKAAENYYGDGNRERCMVALCDRLTRLQNEDVDTFETIIFDGRERQSRRLADWWEDHQKEDQKRRAIEDS